MLFAFWQSLGSLGGVYLRPIINNLVDKDLSSVDKINNLMSGLALMAAIYLVGVICSYLQQRIMIMVSQKALVKIREDLFKKIERLPLKYHDTHTHGDVMSRFTNDLDLVGEMLNNTMTQIFSGVLTLTGTVTLMFITNWLLAIIIIITITFTFMLGEQSVRKVVNTSSVNNKQLALLMGILRKQLLVKKSLKYSAMKRLQWMSLSF